jgi:hypothetical protein
MVWILKKPFLENSANGAADPQPAATSSPLYFVTFIVERSST